MKLVCRSNFPEAKATRLRWQASTWRRQGVGGKQREFTQSLFFPAVYACYTSGKFIIFLNFCLPRSLLQQHKGAKTSGTLETFFKLVQFSVWNGQQTGQTCFVN